MKRKKATQKRTPHASHHPHTQPLHASKKSIVHATNSWLRTHSKIVLAIVSGIILLVGGGILYLLQQTAFTPSVSQLEQQKAVVKVYSPLTGVEVSESDAKRPVTAVMIENSPDARPQSGLKESGVVFESIAESGITRFLVLYQEAKPGVIGPVRSVRPHFASWVSAFDAGLAHVGGSDIPLAKLRGGEIRDLDQFFNAGAYYRSSDRYAPHNMYTSDQGLQELNSAKGYNSSTFTTWPRTKKAKAKASKTPTAQSIDVPISTGLFAVRYQWDAESNTYARQQGGIAHLDRERGQIAPNVVIAMQVPHDIIAESNGFRYPNVIGSGKAWIFQNGTITDATWSKANDKTQVTFQDSNGKEVALNPGQTWISAIRTDSAPTWQ